MTTLSIMAALLPIATGLEEGSELLQSVGLVLIGGLLTSTLLTLVFVPAMYTIFDDIENLALRLIRRSPTPRPKLSSLPVAFNIPPSRPAVLAGQEREGRD
jgi:HAE1 family hydrophobic/amphiphilic exporter-1